MTGLTRGQREGLAVIDAGERAGRLAQVSDHTTRPTALGKARAFALHYRTARNLIDLGLAVDRLDATGDGFRLTATGRATLEDLNAPREAS